MKVFAILSVALGLVAERASAASSTPTSKTFSYPGYYDGTNSYRIHACEQHIFHHHQKSSYQPFLDRWFMVISSSYLAVTAVVAVPSTLQVQSF